MDGVIGSTGALPARQWRPSGTDLTARERRMRLVQRARERTANAPSYPESPEDIAEREATIRAFLPAQDESMREL